VQDLITEWKEIGAKPIQAGVSAGASVRAGEDFFAIQEEIHKLESLDREQVVDWKIVLDRGKIVLGEQSKDLLAASYVSLGLFYVEGLQGLAAGLACIREMAAQHWDRLYPDAKQAKKLINVLKWLREKLPTTVDKRVPSAHDLELFHTCNERAQDLDQLLRDKFGPLLEQEEFGNFGPIFQQRIKDLAQTPPAPVSTGQKGKAGDGQPQPIRGSGTITTPEECRTALRDIDQLIRRVGAFTRNKDLAAPWPYRIARVSAWMMLHMPAPLNNGLSQVPPPAPSLVQLCSELEEKGQWSQLLEQVESQFASQPFWLDPHRMAVHAMKQLGPSYHAARESVEHEITMLIRRLPELSGCRFSDETPFADEETRRWLDELLHADESPISVGKPGTPTSMGPTGPVAELLLHATSLVGQGQVREAVGYLQKESSLIGSEYDRFSLDLEAAKICIRAGYQYLALSQLETLDGRIRRFSLDQWEPKLCLEVWRTLWQLLQQLGKDSKRPVSDWVSRCEILYRRIAEVDVLSAWDLETKRRSTRST